MIEKDIKRSSKKQENREQPGFASREHGGQIKTTIGQKDIIAKDEVEYTKIKKDRGGGAEALGRTNRGNHQGT